MNNSITLIHAAKGKLRREACLRECANGGKCANVQMCKCANGRILLLRWWMKLLMCEWGEMCECLVNVQMCECLVNVRMCKCANDRILLLRCYAINVQMGAERLSCTKATICTFAHSHICTLTKHSHILTFPHFPPWNVTPYNPFFPQTLTS